MTIDRSVTHSDELSRSGGSAGRARRRAVRALAERAGIAYNVARRQLDRGLEPGEMLASHGRTIHPATQARLEQELAARELRPFELRRAETRRAADLPRGRADHLAERFPPTGAERLYQGDDRREILAHGYAAVAANAPDLIPGDLLWTAELGEETAVDLACAALDRAVRRALDGPRPGTQSSYAGARQILDALLIVADDGHAPGTRVRMLDGSGRRGTILQAVWGPAGPPVAYDVLVDGAREATTVDPDDLAVRFA